ncbi:MAG: stage II sporulation protein P [Oscillospiraceae bacterium]|nr:stage II sporulation protein P [Oscillospiraceae bacterium]
MDTDRRVLQVGAAAVVCALLFRLLGGGVMETTVQALSQQRVAEIILFLETGRAVRIQPPADEPPLEDTVPRHTEPEETMALLSEDIEEQSAVAFSQTDAALISVRNSSSYDIDLAGALTKPLSWDLTGEEPTVLIIHTHGTESYVNTEGYAESSPYRSLDEGYNVISVGARLAEALTQKGICVLHDRTLHDHPSYNGSYNQARQTVSKYLAQYPSIQLVLDIHRDAATDADGNQVAHALSTEKGSAAKMMLVLGSHTAGLPHANWQENFALGAKLHAQLEKNQPGICRQLNLRSSRFNQDLMPGMVLVEMGAAGNTRQEALLSAEILAQAIADLAHGTQ